MPSTTFDVTHVALSGPYTVLNIGGHDSAQGGTAMQLDAIVTGSSATLLCFVAGANPTISVDGGAPVTLGTASFTQLPLFSGLTDTAHTIHVTLEGTYVDRPGTITVTGAAPACTLPTGWGAQWALGAYSSQMRVQGGATLSNFAGYTWLRSDWTNGAVAFTATTTEVSAFVYLDGGVYNLQCDRLDVAQVTTPNTGTFGWITFSTGLDGGAAHIYTVESGGLNCYVYSVRLSAGATLGAQPAALAKWAYYGDSITQAVAGTGGNSILGFPHRVGQALGIAPYNLGISGSRVVGTGTAGQARTSDVTSLNPAQVVILYGINDYLAGTISVSTFQSAYTSMLAALVAGTTCPILCLGLIPGNATSAWDTAIQAAVTAQGLARVTFASTSTWVVPATDVPDGIHPNGTGHGKIATQLVPLLNPSPPATPTGLAAPTTVQVAVSWNAVSGVTGYKLYRNGSLLYDGPNTSYSESLSVGAAASYTVLAYNSAGSSALSSAVSAVTTSGSGNWIGFG